METANTSNTSTIENPNFAAFNAENKVSFVREYSPKITNPVAGYRHSVIRYRVITAKKDAGEIKPAKLVTVPALALPAEYVLPEQVAGLVLTMLQDGQDSMIRESVDAGKSVVSWEDITLDKVITFLTTASVSQRLTRESIEAWVSVALKDALDARSVELHEANREKDSIPLAKRAEAVLARYKQVLGSLAAAVPNLKQGEAEAAQAILKRANLDDDMARSLSKKLHAILNPVVLDDGSL